MSTPSWPSSTRRNMSANRAPQTTSSALYDERAWTVWAKVSSLPVIRIRTSASQLAERLCRHAEERALLVDRMDDDPVQRQEQHLGPVERELVEAAHAGPRARLLQPAQADGRRHLARAGCCAALAIRNMSAVPPWKGATTAERLKTIRAVGREMRAKSSPVARAKPISPTSASTVTTRLTSVPFGVMRP